MDCGNWLAAFWPAETRLWFYALERPLTKDQQVEIIERGKKFHENWSAHGKALNADWLLPQPQILIMGVFPGVAPSGCSLDKVSAFIEEMEGEFGMDFRNRKRLVLVKANDVVVGEVEELKAHVSFGIGWLNMYVSTAGDFREKPLLERETAWINRMFNPFSAAKIS
jgi:hypothetical protein